MNRTVRDVVTWLGIGFALYFAARAVWWIEQPTRPALMIASIALFIVVLVLLVLVRAAESIRAPLWITVSTLAASAAIPVMVNLSLAPEFWTEPFATWYIGGLGLLAVVCIVRRRFVFGWGVVLVLAVVSSLYLGLGVSLQLGLVGSVTWAVIAQLLVFFWDRAVTDTERLTGIQRAVSAWHATQDVRRRERRMRAQYALSVAGPVLSRAVAAHGVLTDQERLDARLAEGRLRDELRGASLLNDAVRAAIEDVRRRGASVTVFDEGGLEDLDDQQRARIRDELAEVIAGADSGRIIIRSANDPRVAVTIVGRAGAGESSGEESVGLWHEILRDPAAD